MIPAVVIPDRDHIVGSAAAVVSLVEYGDYECPYCAQAHRIVKAIERNLGRRVAFAYRHFPLTSLHPHALGAAEAAEAAAAQERFWEMHDLLFENQDALEHEDLVQYAVALDLDVARFQRDLGQHVHAGRVRDDMLSGARNGVRGTPTFFVNNQKYEGNFATLQEALEDALEEPSHWQHQRH